MTPQYFMIDCSTSCRSCCSGVSDLVGVGVELDDAPVAVGLCVDEVPVGVPAVIACRKRD